MNVVRLLPVAALAALVSFSTAYARPADCSAPVKPGDKQANVCIDEELKKLDAQLSTVFEAALKSSIGADTVREVQRVWLREQARPTAADYRQQIAVLNQWSSGSTGPNRQKASKYGVYAKKTLLCHNGDRPRPKGLAEGEMDCEDWWDTAALLPLPEGKVRFVARTSGSMAPNLCHLDLSGGKWLSDREIAFIGTDAVGGPYEVRVSLTPSGLTTSLDEKTRAPGTHSHYCSHDTELEVVDFAKSPANKVYRRQ